MVNNPSFTHTIRETANELGLSPAQVEQIVNILLNKGIVQKPTDPQAEFARLKQTIKRRDIYQAVREARQKSHRLLEEQGLTSLSLVIANLLVDFVEQPERTLEAISG